ncbi:Imm53 family immunity protein [Streptomyces antarcticus]|uniref:Imm53 family immunity protein n=1 Tax=Streptomyces antarcticus TaxID=2996458 RepID=UPI00226DB512|nr:MULTISPECIES: Imm53 family immunity protein [unclassified Streptomyces]MCY0947870.1 Imm53 family immunity protein [Streptomyces sp. H34-AA3]MCZ4088440.1 Imm53 family immunity protein [Streptomyces sp. H34-S5]
MSDSESLPDWLRHWHAQQRGGDWEHEWGVRIATLDHPGRSLEIGLEETDPEGREYLRQDVNRITQDSVWTWTAEKSFHAACGPGNFAGALTVFRTGAITTTL